MNKKITISTVKKDIEDIEMEIFELQKKIYLNENQIIKNKYFIKLLKNELKERTKGITTE